MPGTGAKGAKIQRRQRIGCQHMQDFAGLHPVDLHLGFQDRQRALQTRCIEDSGGAAGRYIVGGGHDRVGNQAVRSGTVINKC